jgi:hypothetical protein
MNYYYKGVTDWTWYYPFHYSPFASDLLDCDSFDIKFSESEPFHPIEQLMAVLPPASAHALPEPCRRLMTEPESPIIDFYPNEILTDPNGKPMPWLWVVLLPFIDEKRLLLNMRSLYDQFSEEEKHRNSFGPSFVFVHSSHPLYKKLGSVLDGASETKELWVPATEAGGWSGTLAVPPAGAPCIPVGEDLEAPPKPPDVLHSIQVGCLRDTEKLFALPLLVAHFTSILHSICRTIRRRAPCTFHLRDCRTFAGSFLEQFRCRTLFFLKMLFPEGLPD